MSMKWNPAPKEWSSQDGGQYAQSQGQGWHSEVVPFGRRWRWIFAMLGASPMSGEADGIEAAKAAAEAARRHLKGLA